jgi:hypothetical protein
MLENGYVAARFESTGASPGTFTQRGWSVADLVATVAEVTGNYPSRGSAEKAAWFRDSEVNVLGLGQPIP